MNTKPLPLSSIELYDLIAREIPSLTALRRKLHEHPDLMFEETFAQGLIAEELSALGIPFEKGIAGTGIAGIIETPGAPENSPATGLRADMDALPLQEETGAPWASREPGKMHACGHDGHVTMLIGAARVLSAAREKLPRPVKLIFQPGEEGGMGALKMLEEGVLTEKVCRHPVDTMFALHGYPYGDAGHLYIKPGSMFAAVDDYEVTFHGRGGHGSMPHNTVDPVVAIAQAVVSLQTIVSRNVDPLHPAVITVGHLAAGQKSNIIPGSAVLSATIRTFAPQIRELVTKRFHEVMEHTAQAFGCSTSIEHTVFCPVTNNSEDITRHVMAFARGLLGSEKVHLMEAPCTGSEDFAFFCNNVPSAIAFLGLRPEDAATFPDLHNPHFDFNDHVLAHGIGLLCAFALSGH
ncbi:MAG: amidohydrolase [Candidatus Eremiobacteraeota bacterium]|nr:amidohydrolase [Candidatus Eremiobacteraeota bacterium]